MQHYLTAKFLKRHPHVSGYVFLDVVQDYVRAINARNEIPTTVEAVIHEALVNPYVENVIVGCTEVRQKQMEKAA